MIVVNSRFFNKSKNKKLCPIWNKDKVFFLSLYIKTYLWTYTWIEKKEALAHTRNGSSHKITENYNGFILNSNSNH